MAVKLNLRSIGNKIAGSKKFAKVSKQKVQAAVSNVAKRALKEFDAHPVTLELNFGNSASNLSNTLGGKGNLYTFIGFPEGSNPTRDVRTTLYSTIQFVKMNAKSLKGGKVEVQSKIRIPSQTLADFDGVADMPWQGGSWVKGVENGINGFGSYIYWRTAGRSGAGIQAKTKGSQSPQALRGGSFTPVRYLSEIIENLTKDIKKLKSF